MKHAVLALLLLLPLAAAAQTDAAIEQWLLEGGDEGTAADMCDMLADLRADPANINDTAHAGALPFMTPFRTLALKNYIKLHGYLISTKELALIPGFDSATVALVAPLVKAERPKADHKWWRQQGRHTLVAGIGGSMEQAHGYADGRLEGDNLHPLISYTFKLHRHLSLRLSADKDPAEPWGRGNFCGYYLMLDDIGRLERLVAGHYTVQFGQGLTLWTGQTPFDIVGAPTVRLGRGVKPAGAFSESGYQNGVAATVRCWRQLHLHGFASHAQGKSLLGSHIEWGGYNFNVGATVAYTALADSLVPHHRTYNENAFFGTRLLNAGIDAQWVLGGLTLYSELSTSCDNGAFAATAGAVVNAAENTQFGIGLRHCSPRYHNPNAQPYAIGSMQGQQGVRIDASSRLPLGIGLTASTDLYRLATIRYANYRPTTGVWSRVQAERAFGRWVSAYLRYTFRQQERNIPNYDSTLYSGEETKRHLLQAEARAEAGQWQIAARLMGSLFVPESSPPQQGWLAAATVRYSQPAWQSTIGVAYFDVDGYYARLYLGETNLQYMWSMPMLYGRGWRAHAVLRFSFSESLAVGFKYAISFYPDQTSIGTGLSQTDGPVRQTWHVQIRAKF